MITINVAKPPSWRKNSFTAPAQVSPDGDSSLFCSCVIKFPFGRPLGNRTQFIAAYKTACDNQTPEVCADEPIIAAITAPVKSSAADQRA